ncbi:MAG: hypothetical protein AAGI37_08890 [Planctomycetota bacterium]
MSFETTVHGAIECHLVGGEDVRLPMRVNEGVVAGLPELDKWPSFSRGMFGVVPVEIPTDLEAGLITSIHRTQLIHFGASYRNLEEPGDDPADYLGPWIEKFETLLSQMCWSFAKAHFETEISGHHRYEWAVTSDQFSGYAQSPPIPASKWDRRLFADVDAEVPGTGWTEIVRRS